MTLRRFNLVSQQLAARHWRLVFVVMLVLLHLSATRGASDGWARGFMLAHFGLFMLWQPFMRGEHRLSLQQSVAVLAISAAILLFLNWWLLGLWVSVLAGIVGGKVFLFHARWLRRFYTVVLAYLIVLLLGWIVPNAFLSIAPRELDWLMDYGLPPLLAVMLVVPAESEPAETPQMVDFFYAALLFLVLVVLALGAFAFMRAADLEYGIALSFSLFVIAGVLLALSLAWNPRTGFTGLSMYFSRYLLSIGLPFEQWLRFLAELSQMESRPERFLQEACAGLARLPWVSGGVWRSAEETGEFGGQTAHFVDYTGSELHLRVYSRNRLSPSLNWHFQLLGQLLAEFYLTKVREQKLQQQTYLQAVHETGARMTHDMKNLLQSLNILCSAAELDESGNSAELNELVRRQLPVISQRLQQALAKLQKPQLEGGQFVPAKTWWEGFKRGYQNRNVTFVESEVADAVLIPKELFDSAGDNLLQNALRKRKLDQAVAVEVTLRCADSIELAVCDSGAPVAPQIVQGLLRGPVPSESGFGIGLFQTAKHAAVSGFTLALACNEPGKVCFTLRASAPAAASRA
ncbi:MAG: sensor histidine kinase [Burkholderiales bacterium]|nr:sensor histidine kinase [Burkholderiales bacterium]